MCYVIRIKKHLHNRIELIEIESNRKEYESLHPQELTYSCFFLLFIYKYPNWYSGMFDCLKIGLAEFVFEP